MTPPSLIASIHDVAPSTFDAVGAIAALLDGLNIHPVGLLVVPRHHAGPPLAEDRGLVAWLRARQAQGDEILLHGYEHRLVRPPRSRLQSLRIRALSRGEGEFANLEYAEAFTRLRGGREALDACGLQATGFVAPAYLLSREARRAVADAGFSHVPQLFSLWEPLARRTRFAPAVFFDPHSATTRWLTTFHSHLAQRAFARYRVLRVVIHPPDIGNASTAAALRAALARALRTRVPTTYASLLAR